MESTIEKLDDYVYLKFSGNKNYDELKDALTKTSEKCNQFSLSKVLIDFFDFNFDDVNLTKRIVFGMYLFDKFKSIPNIRVACLLDEQYYDETITEYAKMKGFRYSLFNDKDEALQWLKGSG